MYVLLNRNALYPTVLQRYTTEAAARRGMRASNRNAGYSKRISRMWTASWELEWCYRDDGGLPNTGPYVIMREWDYNRKYVDLSPEP